MQEDALQDARVLYDLMCRFWSSFGHQMSSVLSREGINTPQYMAMLGLADLGNCTMGTISKKLRVTMGASTNIIDKLVNASYVTRTRSTEDRRVVRVELTPKGHETVRRIEETAVNFMAGVLSEEPPEVRKKFLENYTKMVNVTESRETTQELARRHGS
jgi:DNA-binding MarR family transcriptional regulator